MYRTQDDNSPIIRDRIKKSIFLVIPPSKFSFRDKNVHAAAKTPLMSIVRK